MKGGGTKMQYESCPSFYTALMDEEKKNKKLFFF